MSFASCGSLRETSGHTDDNAEAADTLPGRQAAAWGWDSAPRLHREACRAPRGPVGTQLTNRKPAASSSRNLLPRPKGHQETPGWPAAVAGPRANVQPPVSAPRHPCAWHLAAPMPMGRVRVHV